MKTLQLKYKFNVSLNQSSFVLRKAIPLTFVFLILCFHGFAQILVSDSFDSSAVNPNCHWIFPSTTTNSLNYYNTTGNGELLIYASGENGGSDLCGCTNFLAPYLLQAVDTANHNFQIETKLRFNPTLFWMSAGIVFQTSSNSSDGSGLARVVNRYFYSSSHGIAALGGGAVYDDSIVYFRVQKTEGFITTWYSPNDTAWTLLANIADNTPIYYVGLVSERYAWSNDPLIPSAAYFDYFNVSAVTGIDEFQNDQSISIYPNPAKEMLNVSIKNKRSSNDIFKIENIIGETMMVNEIKANDLNIDISKLESGIYFLSIENSSGKIVKKFIKE